MLCRTVGATQTEVLALNNRQHHQQAADLLAGSGERLYASRCVGAGSTVPPVPSTSDSPDAPTPGMGAPWSAFTYAAAGLGCLPVRPSIIGGSVELRGWDQVWRCSAVAVGGGQEHSGREHPAGIGFIDPGRVRQKNADGEPLLRELAISIAGWR